MGRLLTETAHWNQMDTRTISNPSVSVNGDSRAFSFTAVSDLVQEPPEETSYVWGRILPRAGVSIIGAKPKVGKSTFGRGLANAVASGEDFLGYPTSTGNVLCIALEEKRSEVTDHFRRMGAQGSNLIVHVGPSPKNPLEALELALQKYSPVLVEIDPLSRFLHVADLSAYAEVTRHLEPIIDLARKYGPHILIPHHNKKGNGESGEDDLLGSTGLFGGVDTLLIMRKRQGRRTLQSIQRYGEDLPETIVYLDPETGMVSAGEEMAAVLLREREEAILNCLSNQSALSERGIKSEVGGGGLTSKALRALFSAGKVHRDGSGKKGDAFVYRFAVSVEPNKPNNPAFSETQNRTSENSNKKGGFGGYRGIYRNPTTHNPEVVAKLLDLGLAQAWIDKLSVKDAIDMLAQHGIEGVA